MLSDISKDENTEIRFVIINITILLLILLSSFHCTYKGCEKHVFSTEASLKNHKFTIHNKKTSVIYEGKFNFF